jgi:hypothetical protein
MQNSLSPKGKYEIHQIQISPLLEFDEIEILTLQMVKVYKTSSQYNTVPKPGGGGQNFP